MEEDIKILEDYLLGKKMQYGSGYIYFREFVALENLIKGYRELEERNKQCIKVGDLERAVGFLMNRNDLSNYIPKSKVKEKIEKLKKEFDFYAGREHCEWQDGEFDGDVCDDLALKIRTLKELMEDK